MTPRVEHIGERRRGTSKPSKRCSLSLVSSSRNAKLFYRSGWTQEELAKKEGKSRTWIVYRLQFGRFLDFVTTGDISQNPAISKLTERKFRSYWERTDCGPPRWKLSTI